MEMCDRVRELRKNHLRMTQEAFAQRLGVSRSVIKNIELNALARPDQKLSLIKLMCKEFSVNEDWLLYGTEPMFIDPETFSLDEFVKSRGMSDLEMEILETYLELDPDIRQKLIEHFRTHWENREIPEKPEEDKGESSEEGSVPDDQQK